MHKTEKKKADARFLCLPLAAIVLRIVVVNNKSFPQKRRERQKKQKQRESVCVNSIRMRGYLNARAFIE